MIFTLCSFLNVITVNPWSLHKAGAKGYLKSIEGPLDALGDTNVKIYCADDASHDVVECHKALKRLK